MNTTLDTKLLDNMSEEELVQLRKEVYARLDSIAAEKRRREELRKNYKLLPFEREYHVNYWGVYNSLCDVFEKFDTPITKEGFENIVKGNTYSDPLRYDEIYICPICGNTSLQVCKSNTDRYYIECTECEFEIPKKYRSYYESEAWEMLHEYLIKHKYLDESVEFPR